MIRNALIMCMSLCAALVQAHEGEGGAHVHDGELLGFALLVLALGMFAWHRSRK